MEPEIVTYANRVHPHQAKTRAELVEEIHDLSPGVLTAPGPHPDDRASIVPAFTYIRDGFSFSSADVHSGDQGRGRGIVDWGLECALLGPLEPDHLDERVLRLVR